MRYNEWVDVACHNCYIKGVSRFSEAFRHTRTFEIDITDRPVNTGGAKPVGEAGRREWYVRHDDNDKRNDNQNRCGPEKNQSTDLRGCLRDIKHFMDPDSMRLAPVLTLYLDLKFTGWGGKTGPQDLDTMILNALGPDRVIRPAEILPPGDFTMADSARKGRWLQLRHMRGRIVVVLTGGTGMGGEILLNRITSANQILSDYVEARRNRAVAFVAAEVLTGGNVRDVPGFTPEMEPYVVFYNYSRPVKFLFPSYEKVGKVIGERGAVGRIWWRNDSDPPSMNACRGIRAGFQRPAIYAINSVQPCSTSAVKPSAAEEDGAE